MSAQGERETSAPPEGEDHLAETVKVRSERHRRWRQEGEPAVARRLAQVGVLGWIIVVPTLAGIFLGRWLDGHFGTGLTLTGAFLMIGVAIGCWSAWRWMHQQ